MIKKRIVLHIIFLSLLSLSQSSCGPSYQDIDIDAIELEMKLQRYEQALFATGSTEDLLELNDKFPDFHPIYLYNIMPQPPHMGSMTEVDLAMELRRYISHPDPDSLFKLTQEKFDDLEREREELEKAAKRIYHYFPDEKIETMVSFVSSFEFASIFIEESKAFALGLDMYMGRDFEIYPLLDPSRFPAYRVQKFEPYYMIPNAVKSFLYYKVPKVQSNSFIQEAIYEGKILFAMDKLLPATADSLKISYAKGQIEWCKANEENIWAYLVENEVLFSSDKNAYISKFFNDGPFTTPFGNESSPRAGAWVGWQIVRSYMERNPNTSLVELIFNDDHDQIYRESKYKP